MARIRTIKPEIWSSPQFTALSPTARLLFIAMFNWADDYGRGTCEPRELMGFAFPRDEDMTVGDFRRVLGEIHRVLLCTFYTVDGRPFYEIPTWDKHQKVDKRSQGSRYPSPSEGVSMNPVNGQVIDDSEFSAEDSGENIESSEETRRWNIGNRNIGNRNIKDMGQTDVSPDSSPKPKKYPDNFEQWWTAYPSRQGSSKKQSLTEWRKALKEIGEDELLDRTLRYANNPGCDPKYIPRAENWLKKAKWETVDEVRAESKHSNNGFLNMLQDDRVAQMPLGGEFRELE